MDLWDILFRTLIVLTVLTVPIRIGVRVAQWGRRRAHEPPLARVWTHPLWLVYEAVVGSMAGYLLYYDALHIITGDSYYLATNGIWRWSFIAGASCIAIFCFRAHFRFEPMNEDERIRRMIEWHGQLRKKEYERLRDSNAFTTRTGSYTFMRDWDD
ncbi:MAG: hypothetical protein NNA21_07000 [Nitrospira sp.]|nr:hypothetical protein [Nitrospira sp.]